MATILFADISGFTSLSEKMDPEELSSLINEYLKIMSDIIESNEGTIDKFIGDCAMALFGIPIAIEKAPNKAINAAIEIKNKIAEFNKSQKLKKSIGVHIGINTGIVVSGPLPKDFTAMGDTVNIASRLKDVSKSGEVFVGDFTYQATKRDFNYVKLDPILLKGKSDPCEVYKLLSEKKEIYRSPLGSGRMISSKMVGREKELNLLSMHLLNVINGKGAIVSIIGEAGIGKSRLIAELITKREISQVALLIGRGLSIGLNLSFHPFIDIIKQWAKISDEDSDRLSLLKLAKTIRNLHPDRAEEIFPFIAIMMGLRLTGRDAERISGIEGEALEKLILKSLYTLIEKGTAIQPVLFIMEDLHWSDLTSIEFLKSLFQLALDHRILFINIFRPGYEETTDKLSKSIDLRYNKIHSVIPLASLPERQSGMLLKNLIKVNGFPLKVKERIIKRTSGYPFFIEEVVRSFIDEGAIKIINKKFTITDNIDNVKIPESISEVLMSRIDKLDAQTRSLLKTASVIGRSFFYRILAKVVEEKNGIDSKLAYLEEIQLIKEKRKVELEYLFKHALAQEATYESILVAHRKELHLTTARAIETVFKEKLPDFYGVLAMHFSRGGDETKAEEYLMKAGKDALKSSASEEALNYFKEALNLYTSRFGVNADPQRIAMMEKNIGIALHNKGRYAEATIYFDKTLLYYEIKVPKYQSRNKAIGSFLTNILVAMYLPFLKWRRAPKEKDIEILKLLFLQLGDIGVSDTKRYLGANSFFFKYLTKYKLTNIKNGTVMLVGAAVGLTYKGISISLSNKIMSFLKDKVDREYTKDMIYYAFSICLNMRLEGRWKEHHYNKSLVEEALKKGEIQCVCWYLINDFFIHLGKGEFDEAEERIIIFSDLSRQFDHLPAKGYALSTKSKLLVKKRKIHEAFNHLEESISFYLKIDDNTQLFWLYSYLACLQLLVEDIPSAERTLEMAKDIKPVGMPKLYETVYYVNRIRIDLHYLSKAKKNNEHLIFSKMSKKIYHLSKKTLTYSKVNADERTEICRLMGTYYWVKNNHKKAFSWWKRSLTNGKKIGALPEVARTYLEVGRRMAEDLQQHNKFLELTSTECLALAQNIFSELGLEWDLEELLQIKSRLTINP